MNKAAIAILTFVGSFLFFVSSGLAVQPVELFGVPLYTATRAQLKPALVKAGFIWTNSHINAASFRYYNFTPLNTIGLKGSLKYDEYRAIRQLKGGVGYTISGRFAIAEYFIECLYNADVLAILKDKYGRPDSVVALSEFNNSRFKYI